MYQKSLETNQNSYFSEYLQRCFCISIIFVFKNNWMDGQNVTQTISDFQARKEVLRFPEISLASTLPLQLRNGYPKNTW